MWICEVALCRESGMATQNPKLVILLEELQRNNSLPVLSQNTQEVCLVSSQENSSAANLAAVIMRDCGMTSNILALANSAYYCPLEPVKTVSGAVMLLGFEKVRSMVMGFTIFQQSTKGLRNRELTRLYAASYFCGSFSMALAKDGKCRSPEEAFVVGLLYQLPRIALANAFPEKFRVMETMVQEQGVPLQQACLKVFEVSYDELCDGIAGLYNLGKRPMQGADTSRMDLQSRLVQEAGKLAGMMFSEKATGKAALDTLSKDISKLLGRNEFPIDEFVKRAGREDPNMGRFFNLKEDDLEMMVKILEWGKASPAQITPGLAFGEAIASGKEPEKEDPEVLFGRLMTELAKVRRKAADINQTLMIAQETLFRCLSPAHVFVAFLDEHRMYLVGRLYTGANDLVTAGQFRVAQKPENSPLVRCLNTAAPGQWGKGESDLGLSEPLMQRLKLHSAVFAPVTPAGRTVGLYFVGRDTDMPFSEREQVWLEQVAEQVSFSFEAMSRLRASRAAAAGPK